MKRRVGNPTHNYAKEWKSWRTKHKLTQSQLAQTLDITRKTIYNIESKRHRPNVSTRKKFRELVNRYEVERSSLKKKETKNVNPAN